MKAAATTGNSTVKPTLQLAALAMSAGLACASVQAAPTLSAFDLGLVNGVDLNASGQVVGSFVNSGGLTRGFFTGVNGQGFTELGTLGGSSSSAVAINNAGLIVGNATTASGAGTAFVSNTSGAGLTALAAGSAAGVNSSGQIVVNAAGSSGSTQILRYDSATSAPQNITPTYLQGQYVRSRSGVATGLNDAGSVVGTLVETCNCSANVRLISGPGSIGYYTPSSGFLSNSTAASINNAGVVVGSAGVYEPPPVGRGSSQAVAVNSLTGEWQNLGNLGGYNAWAYDINNLGWVVGESTTTDGASHAFMANIAGGPMLDLNNLIDLPTGVAMSRALAINDVGQVLALGTNAHTYLLSAVPEPSTLATWLLGLVGMSAVARRRQATKP